MSTVAAFVLGLLVGWLVEWIIDWIYWRRKYGEVEQERASLKLQVNNLQGVKNRLEAQVSSLQAEKSSLYTRSDDAQTDRSALESQVVALSKENADLKARLESALSSAEDDLEAIKGIGPVINKLLNEAGIFTFAELGALTTEQLRLIVGQQIEGLADEADILAQARELAEK